MLDVEDYADVKIGLEKAEGDSFDDVVAPPAEASTGVTKAIKSEADKMEEGFRSVQIAAEFPDPHRPVFLICLFHWQE